MNEFLMNKIRNFLAENEEDYIIFESKPGGYVKAYPRDYHNADVRYKYGCTMYVFTLSGNNRLKVNTVRIYQGSPSGHPEGNPFWI